jgi:hypothetical protein
MIVFLRGEMVKKKKEGRWGYNAGGRSIHINTKRK